MHARKGTGGARRALQTQWLGVPGKLATHGVAGPSSSSVAPTVDATKVWLNCHLGGASPSWMDRPSKGTALGNSVMFCGGVVARAAR